MKKYSKVLTKIVGLLAIVIAYFAHNAVIAGVCLYITLCAHNYFYDGEWDQHNSQHFYMIMAIIFLWISSEYISPWVITAIFAGGVINWAAMAQNGYCIEDLQKRIGALEGRDD